MGKITTAVFEPGSTTANVYGLWQYDYGQTLRIQGLHLPSAVEIHFSLQETGGTSPSRVGVTKDGVTDVIIPDSMLENDGATRNYDMFAFVYLTDDTSGQTEYKIKLQVKSRPKPEVPGGGENPDIFHEAVQAVQKSADKAAESEKQAEGWAHGREDLPERAQDNARYYAGQTAADAKKTGTDRKEVERLVDSVSGIDEQVMKVEDLTKQAQTSATNAALSEQAAKTAENNAQVAQAGAETAEGNAELAERNVKASEQAVEKAKQLVTQMGQEVLDNKNHVDQTVQAFDQTAQQAVADVNNAGQTQTERVQSAGNTAVESVKTAQGIAMQAVETAKTEAVKAVQTEGTTQTGNVTAEGEKQVQAVQAASQEIVADREQIAQNKAGVEALKQGKADAIVETISGTLLNIKDSAYARLIKLEIDKNVDWIKITGKNLLDAQGDKTGKQIESMEFGVGSIKYTLKDNYGGACVNYSKVFEPGKYVITAKITNNGNEAPGFRCGFDKNITVNGNELIYNNFYQNYLMRDYAKKIEITSGESFCVMFAVETKGGVIGDIVEFTEMQIEKGEAATPYEPYCTEQIIEFPVMDEKISMIHTNYPTTIISNSKEAYMEVSYVADTKNYIASKIETPLQKQITDLQNALISQKISGGGYKSN